jgi:hypothetical protein
MTPLYKNDLGYFEALIKESSYLFTNFAQKC